MDKDWKEKQEQTISDLLDEVRRRILDGQYWGAIKILPGLASIINDLYQEQKYDLRR